MARRTCATCSASMKCNLHRQSIPKPTAPVNAPAGVRTDDGLMRPQLSRTNSVSSSAVVRRRRSVENICPAEVARRAVRLACRSRGPQKIRRKNFESKPSRLSQVSTAADC
ncbi:hypothetical protein SUGI_0099430 [Cryptomeria japonica]|nr:hypothetical protein SUGI_0099430 [Cryptomeria japonica]